MKSKQTPPPDTHEIRCPRLGHQIHFGYCRTENSLGPCFKVLDCWHPHFDVAGFLRSELREDQWERLITRQATPKMTSLVELIEQARKRAGRSPSAE